ncbi:MAG: hypothetical protein ACP5GZ_11380 [Vulcanisaeta sp.]|uniref:hypothetical protein n=1 Tax=Vulcanisaeta sp. TaxID=2020871 RepID=UPI003D0B08B7
MHILVGDNPFHGIKHLAQSEARFRGGVKDLGYAIKLVISSRDAGADGFMLSVSDTTLSILNGIRDHVDRRKFLIAAIAPYAYEYVRKATVVGTVGLVKEFVDNVTKSSNIRAIYHGFRAAVSMDLLNGLKALIDYELGRIKNAYGSKPWTLMLHELIVDTLVPYGLTEVLAETLEYIRGRGVVPGIETRNLPTIYRALREYSVMDYVVFSAPFNSVGFQMSPSKEAYEEFVRRYPGKLIAFSVLASGLLKPREALDYVAKFKNELLGIVIGVSKEEQVSVFKLARELLG